MNFPDEDESAGGDTDRYFFDPPTDEVFRTAFDTGSKRSLNNAIVDAVAAVSGRRPTELPPLHDTIDTDAIEAMFKEDRTDEERKISLTFSFAGYVVRVRSEGTILVFSDGSDTGVSHGEES